ncbi:type II secretion system protein [Desulfovirgula thermocuniculi]|uniref:type II secretion system protein n=1 Tax=Desulfovirgula thermocuniculi TaxID=348842 RepID=UPI001FE0F31A|nr:type II secretion system protein [Desulfovirgula thermocuniculi]
MKTILPTYLTCRAFTLVELLVVIAIIGVLAAIIAPNASYYADMGFFPTGREPRL